MVSDSLRFFGFFCGFQISSFDKDGSPHVLEHLESHLDYRNFWQTKISQWAEIRVKHPSRLKSWFKKSAKFRDDIRWESERGIGFRGRAKKLICGFQSAHLRNGQEFCFGGLVGSRHLPPFLF